MKRRFTSLWQGLGQRNETSDDGWVGLVFGDPKHGDFLLLKVASVFLVDEDEVEVVARAELFVDVAEGGRELKAAEEEADGDGLAADGGAVHDFELGDGLGLVVLVGCGACCLAADDGELHVLDLDAHEKKVDLAHDDVFEMVPVGAEEESDGCVRA